MEIKSNILTWKENPQTLWNKVSRIFLNRVMRSDQNSFCGDLVLDSVNMVFRDEENIFDQIHET